MQDEKPNREVLPPAPEVDPYLILGYIDNVLPSEQARRDIQLLIKHDPQWRRMYEELRQVAEDVESGKGPIEILQFRDQDTRSTTIFDRLKQWLTRSGV